MELFGLLPDGQVVNSFELINEKGMKLKVINYGATITSLKVPNKEGELVDVVLGFDTLASYMKSFELAGAPYFGSTVGRFAGRINKGEFNLNGEAFHLNKNNNGHSLHGGIHNFSQKLWKLEKQTQGENPSVSLSYVSPDKEENYPGELSVSLTYTLSEDNELIIEYLANTTKDTVVNLTHHSYFNLDGHKSTISDQDLIVNSSKILEKTNDNIPTGKFLELANGAFDYKTAKKCPSNIDDTFVLEDKNEFAAALFNKANDLKMTVYTDQPAVHIYVGGGCEDIKGKEEAVYHALSGICFETQNFPDAPNQGHFPTAILKKEASYHQKTRYKFE
ncbi:aldose epimerase family protein [Flavobacterium granuli]|uniref:Aldose 1-epimerase n=1 Tax=Flavobacterium granuli TaxID=280093 RepID=A0A1M5M473_9FLAO|nr:aldose epimerase family protein [Flavobacterium granuli]PRZ24191.1 aldose 1-epimerase [Flavobacterium granuli]SHG71503.1 aldose 1-epimerase [Flavobacterium granuli]